MHRKYNIHLKDDISQLIKLENNIKQFSKENALSDDLSYFINLVCEEIFVNTIIYGKAKASSIEVIFNFAIKDNVLAIIIEDNGMPFNPLQIASPKTDLQLTERPVGKLGIFLTRQWANTINYKRENEKNILSLKKTIG